MGKTDEREAFRQTLLKMAKYRLREVLRSAGLSPQESRAAEVLGEDHMIELIMVKYDEGAIKAVGLEKSKSDPAPEEKPKEGPRTAKRPPKEEEDPYSSAFDDDDDDKPEGGDEDSPHDEVEGESDDEADDESDDGVEKHDTDPPRKAERKDRKAKKTEEPGSDLSALEAKVDKLMDLTVSTVEAVVELRDVVLGFVEKSTTFMEIVKLAFARIWKLGAANPLKPGFSDVIARAEEVASKLRNKTPERED